MGNVLKNPVVTMLEGVEPAKARALLLTAALRMTRMDKEMRRACRLVILHGLTPVDAGIKVARQRQNVCRALRTLRPKLVEVVGQYNVAQLHARKAVELLTARPIWERYDQ